MAGIGCEGEEEDEDEGERHLLCLLLLAVIKARLKGSPHFSQRRCKGEMKQWTDRDRSKQNVRYSLNKSKWSDVHEIMCPCVFIQ